MWELSTNTMQARQSSHVCPIAKFDTYLFLNESDNAVCMLFVAFLEVEKTCALT